MSLDRGEESQALLRRRAFSKCALFVVGSLFLAKEPLVCMGGEGESQAEWEITLSGHLLSAGILIVPSFRFCSAHLVFVGFLFDVMEEEPI